SLGLGSLGQVNFVETMPPIPTVEAKSRPPVLSSTWSPAKAAPGPIRALSVLPLCRTCQEDSGSEAGAWLNERKLKNEYAVPQGHNSTTASGLSSVAVR